MCDLSGVREASEELALTLRLAVVQVPHTSATPLVRTTCLQIDEDVALLAILRVNVMVMIDGMVWYGMVWYGWFLCCFFALCTLVYVGCR